MKNLIVLSAVVMTATFSLTSCDKTTKTETVVTETSADTLAQPEADTVVTETATETTVVSDTVTVKK